jgi:ketosteroid isomerase-like protein
MAAFHRAIGRAVVLIACAAASACSSSAPPQPTVQAPPPFDPAAIEKQIRSMDADWSHAANLGDVELCISYYADDGMLLAPNEPIATGKEALRKSWAALVTGPQFVGLTFGPKKISVAQAGDVAWDVGTYELTTKDKDGKASTEAGKYVEVWQKQIDGSWKVEVDAYNSGQ